MPYSPTQLRELAEHWIAAWNAHDLDAIMSHYAADVEFEVATAVVRFNRADGKLHGASELREHFRRGLEKVPELRFELEQVFFAPGGYAALYRRENGNRVVDAVELDGEAKVKRATAYYLAEQK